MDAVLCFGIPLIFGRQDPYPFEAPSRDLKY